MENILSSIDNDATPLHKAVASDDKETIIALIAKGYDANAIGLWGARPLHEAKSPDTAEILIR